VAAVSPTEVLVALAILVGLVGVIVPILPGLVLVLAAILVWAVSEGSATGWTVFAVAAVLIVAGSVVKYAVPNRRLKTTGIPSSTATAERSTGCRSTTSATASARVVSSSPGPNRIPKAS
jgi:hypothetical protein